MIEATFWKKRAFSINKEAITLLPSPVIISVTSMKVSKFEGLQLSITAVSHVYINPDIDEAKAMANAFSIRNNVKTGLKIRYEKSENTMAEKHRNRFTLAELLAQNPNRHMGTQFTCKASITNIDEKRGWFYKACDQCLKKLQPRGTTFTCEDHQPVIEPRNLFSFATNIEDNTAEAKAIFFDNAANLIL